MSRHTFADRAAWLAGRGIGSSDIAAILGVSPHHGAWDLYLRLRGEAPPDADSAVMARGRRWEPIVLGLYAEESGLVVEREEPHTLYVHAEHPWATCSPDGWAVDRLYRWPVEAKTDRDSSHWGPSCEIERWTDGCEQVVRPDYYLQCLWQMAVLDVDRVDLVVLLPSYELRVYRLHRDEEALRAVVEQVRAWYERHVVQGEPPEIDGSDACRLDLARRFRGGEPMREAGPDERGLVLELARIRRELKELEEDKAQTTAELLAAAGNARGLHLGDERGLRALVVRVAGRQTLDAAALRQARPDLVPVLDQFTKQGAPSAQVRLYGEE